MFPFYFATTFVLAVRVEHNRFVIMLNDQYFGDFQHRVQPLNLIDMIKIWGDVSVSSVSLSNDY